jgi:tetratricopeptide (TPR) repeat protein
MKNYLFFILLIFFITVKVKAQTNSSDKKIDSIYNTLTSNKIDEVKAEQIMGIIGKLRYPENSQKIIRKILKLSKREKNIEQTANAHYALGNYYFYNAKLDSALAEIENAETFLKNVTNPLLKSSVKMTRGGILLRKGDIVEANYNFLESLNLLDKIDTLKLSKADRIKRKGKKLVLFNSIADFNTSTENYDKANLYYEKAISMSMDMNNKRVASILLSNQGDLLIK